MAMIDPAPNGALAPAHEQLSIDIEASGARTEEEVAIIERRLGIGSEATRALDASKPG
jgi:hypothetical protein